MYKELATILMPDKSLGGFVVYDDRMRSADRALRMIRTLGNTADKKGD